MLRFISGVGNELGKIYDLVTRFDFENNGTTSDLVDPVTADDAFIPWLAVLAGVRDAGTGPLRTPLRGKRSSPGWTRITVLPTGMSSTQSTRLRLTRCSLARNQDLNIASRASYLGARAQISRRITFGYDEGTAGSIERAVKSVLQGVPYCVTWVTRRGSCRWS